MTEREYTVTWTIQVSAYSAEDAADWARDVQADPQTHATVYVVTDDQGVETVVDLTAER